MTSRSWVFTINNPTDGDTSTLLSVECKYICYQLERGELRGTKHYQGYVIFKSPIRRVAAVRHVPRAHMAAARGSPDKNRTYCSKQNTRIGDSFIERGEFPTGSGHRTDIERLRSALESGAGRRELWDDNFSSVLRFHRGVSQWYTDHPRDRTRKPYVRVFIGEPGTGKSEGALALAGEGGYWVSPANATATWFDGYDQRIHTHIVLDDFYGWLRWTTLLRLLDRFPLGLQAKGTTIQVGNVDIVITSNAAISTWYNYNERMVYGALLRRIDEVWLCEKDVWVRGSTTLQPAPVFVPAASQQS